MLCHGSLSRGEEVEQQRDDDPSGSLTTGSSIHTKPISFLTMVKQVPEAAL